MSSSASLFTIAALMLQFNRKEDSSLKQLPAKHVDTGMGMERVTSILQDKVSNYATDAFTPIFDEIQAVSGAPPYTDRVRLAPCSCHADCPLKVFRSHCATWSSSGCKPSQA